MTADLSGNWLGAYSYPGEIEPVVFEALLEEPILTGRADMLVQLMQFQRLNPGGADSAQTVQ